nr:uncharacterized protein LOC129262528 [Lytechinus pictus]
MVTSQALPPSKTYSFKNCYFLITLLVFLVTVICLFGISSFDTVIIKSRTIAEKGEMLTQNVAKQKIPSFKVAPVNSSKIDITRNFTSQEIPPPTIESKPLRLDGEQALPKNVIPDLHSLLRIDDSYTTYSDSENKECMRPKEKGTNGSDYIAGISQSNFVTTEEKVFNDLAEKARDLTRHANEQLKIFLKNRYTSALNDKADAKPELAAQAGMGMTIGSYMYFPGGHWVPMHCKAKWKVAVVIPYRNRSDNLNVLTRNLIPFLKGQDLEFGIFVAEQSFSEIMNRGMMRNIGFQMANLSGTKWDCFVFHDVDFIPLNSTNYYGCDSFPIHFASRLEIFNYT